MGTRRRYRELIAAPDILVMPGVYDALSARIAEASGFAALVAGGNAAVGAMLAGPDIGQSNMRDYADHYARICAAVEIPVSVDADTGFGDVHNVRQTVRSFEAAGVAGLMISDQVFPNRCGYLAGKQVVPVEEMVAKIKAALDARRDPDLVVIARTDAAGRQRPRRRHRAGAALPRSRRGCRPPAGRRHARGDRARRPRDPGPVLRDPLAGRGPAAAGHPGSGRPRRRRRHPADARPLRRRPQRFARPRGGEAHRLARRRRGRVAVARRLLRSRRPPSRAGQGGELP